MNEILPDTLLVHWFEISPGAFHVSSLTTDKDLQQLYIDKLERFVESGVLEHWGEKRGWYIPTNSKLEEMDLVNVESNPVDIWLPFGCSDLVEIYPGNLIIIAGQKDSGKTAVMLNMVYENDDKWDVSYFNSEMGPEEFRKRIDKFPYRSIDMWDFKAYRRGFDFHHVIKKGPSNLNIIDFLEIHDEFYAIGRALKNIHDNLDGAIAVVCLQKNPGVDVGLGGWRSMEVTRFALSLEHGKVKIISAKNFRKPDVNPRGWFREFSIVGGCQIRETTGWRKYQEKEG